MQLRKARVVLALLGLAVGPALGQDYRLGSLTQNASASLPGHVRGVLCQTEPGGPLRFSRDGFLVPNVYVPSPTDKTPHDFQVDSGGDRLHLSTGFRAMTAADVSRSAPPFSLDDVVINDGKGVKGLNGMLITRCRPASLDLNARIAALGHDVDRVARGYGSRIKPFFAQKKKGRDLRVIDATWLADANAVQVRFARAVAGRATLPAVARNHGPRWSMWEVPYLTVCYRLRPDGKVISRTVVPPGDPLATARKYNPRACPW